MFTSFNARALGLQLSARDTLELAQEAGFEGVDLLVRDLLERGEDPRQIRALMDELGLRGGAWPLPVAWRGEADQFQHDLEELPRYAEAAATLGLLRTCTWVMPETLLAPREPDERAEHLREIVKLHCERLGAIARAIDPYGSRLGLEVIGVESFRTGRGLPFVHRLADLDRVLGAIWREAPTLGVLVDAFHLYAADEPLDSALAWGVDRVVWVHVADLPAGAPADRALMQDNDRGLPGEHGAIDAKSLLAKLCALGYEGPVTAEPMAGCRSFRGLSAQQVAQTTARALRSIWPER